MLEDLEEFTLYEVILQAYNDLGTSGPSPIEVARTREAAPGASPDGVTAEATSSTTILVQWGTVAKVERNGIIDGYKVGVFNYSISECWLETGLLVCSSTSNLRIGFLCFCL